MDKNFIILHRYALKPQFIKYYLGRAVLEKETLKPTFLRYDLFQPALKDYIGYEDVSLEHLDYRLGIKADHDMRRFDNKLVENGKNLAVYLRSLYDFWAGSMDESKYHWYKDTQDLIDKFIYQRRFRELKTTNELTQWYFDYWRKQTFKERKKMIRKNFPKKRYSEINALLNKCNHYLDKLAGKSFEYSRNLSWYCHFGLSIDWLFQILTETTLVKDPRFKDLFENNIRVQNDLVSVLGELNILDDREALELLFQNRIPHIEEYLTDFNNMLVSGIQAGMVIEKQLSLAEGLSEIEEQENKKFLELSKEESKLAEIESYHNIAVEHTKIHDIDRLQ